MPQAVLPDINTSFIKWRNKIATALEARNYTAVFGSLNNFNACLEDKFQVHISTPEYELKLAAEKLLCVCAKCKKPQDYRTVHKLNQRTTPLIELLRKIKYEQVWICPDCNHDNLIQKTEFLQEKIPNPCYLGVVPDPPKRRDGIMDRKSFHKKFENWTWTFFGELENAATKYRIANWQKGENLDNMQIGLEDETDS
ncbi:MAG: hypothetical protein LV468_03115 [Candidatus Nitrosotenuis sp.]|nr:hypothetical protein [Candidatus Nitrosotenuis sp.]